MEASLTAPEGAASSRVFAEVCEVAAQIDERIGLGLDNIALPSDLKTLLVPCERTIEVLQLAIDPPDAVGHAREPEAITVPSAHFHGLMERRQGVRHPPTVTLDKPQAEEVAQEHERVA